MTSTATRGIRIRRMRNTGSARSINNINGYGKLMRRYKELAPDIGVTYGRVTKTAADRKEKELKDLGFEVEYKVNKLDVLWPYQIKVVGRRER